MDGIQPTGKEEENTQLAQSGLTLHLQPVFYLPERNCMAMERKMPFEVVLKGKQICNSSKV